MKESVYGINFIRCVLDRILEYEQSGAPTPFYALVIFDKSTGAAYPSSNLLDTPGFVAAMHAAIAWKHVNAFVDMPPREDWAEPKKEPAQ